jgi:RHS repeat-associated protein
VTASARPISQRAKASNYNYFRDYDPALGRYIESDPVALGAGLNTYGYVGADPIAGIDPRGLARFNIAEMRDMIGRNNFSGFSNELIMCIAWNESNFDPFRESGTGPRGLMMVSNVAVQDLSSNGYHFNQSDVDVDPEQNIGAGSAYLGHMQRRWKGKQKAIHKYGTGDKYPVPKILDCEKCLQQTPPCKDSTTCLEKVHK